MKFWKSSLLAVLGFFAITASVLYSACTIDTCADVKCYNGGACISGYCQCPSGFEGAACQDTVMTKFRGTFAGNTSCTSSPGGALPAIFDTAVVYMEQFPLNMGVVLYSHRTDTLWPSDTLHGVISGSNIVIPDYSAPRYTRSVTVSLSGNRLSILTLESHTEGDKASDVVTTKTQCPFYGMRQ